jgi:hypothetical protein
MRASTAFVVSVLAGIILLALDRLTRKKKPAKLPQLSGRSPVSISEIDRSMSKIASEYGTSIARDVERIYRIETANFTSGQFQKSLSAGMEPATEIYPYGWTTPKKIWDAYPNLAPIGLTEIMTDSGGRRVRFIRFPSFYAAAKTLAEYVKKYGTGRWFSTDPSAQRAYNQKLSNIQTKFV